MKLQNPELDSMADEDMIINDVDDSIDVDNLETSIEDEDTVDLPTSLIITNLDSQVFESDQEKANFEALFRQFEDDVTFQYFKSFRRARVNFKTAHATATARIQLHQTPVCDTLINCYFAQASTPREDPSDPHLHPPAPVKQFLISPPASPPVGWEPRDEAQPSMNYDLLAAVANLSPGEAHELHPPSDNQPGIVVHVCEDNIPINSAGKPKIQQTRCPERKC